MAKIVTVLPAISSISTGQLFREEYPYIGSQVFTTVNNYSQVYSVEVLGVGALSLSQYHLESPNKVVIHDPLEVEDYIVIIYGKSNFGSAPYYTQAQIDILLDDLEEELKDYTDDSFVRGARLYARTGIVDKADQFKLDVLDANTVTIGAVDSALFWDQLFGVDVDPNTAIRSFTELPYPLTELVTATGLNTNISPIVLDGIYVRYLGYDIVGGIVSSPDSFIETSAIVQLGFVTVVKSGVNITFLGGITPGARNVFSQPILASLNDLDRITVTNVTDITVGYNIGTPTLNTNPGIITGISINWRSLSNPTNTSSIDKYNYLGDDIVDFVSIDANFLEDTSAPVVHTLWTDLAEGVAINKSFYNTTSELRDTLAASAFSIKRVLIGVRGGIFIQDGEHATNAGYATIDAAKANIYTQTFTNAIVPEGLVIEIARIIFQENVTNFADSTKFFIVGTLGGSSSGGGIVTVGDATTVAKGIIQLAGDLSGTATAPTVPGLLLKANDADVVHLTGTEIITGSKEFSSIVTASGFKTPTGTAAQFLKANGSIDSTIYANNTNVIHTSGNEIRTGSLTSDSFKTPTGTAAQFLKANGTIDSTIYSVDAGAMHLAGNETFTGTKTFAVVALNSPGILLTNTLGGNSYGLKVDNTGSGGAGIYATNTAGTGIQTLCNGSGQAIVATNLSSGFGIYASNNASGTGIQLDNVSSGTGFNISNTSTGNAFRVSSTNTGTGINVIHSGTTGTAVNITATTGSGNALVINSGNSGTGGKGINIGHTGFDIGISIANSGSNYSMYINHQGSSKGLLMAGTSSSTMLDIQPTNCKGMVVTGPVGSGGDLITSNAQSAVAALNATNNYNHVSASILNLNNTSTGALQVAIKLNNASTATGDPFQYSKNSVVTTRIADNGNIISPAFVKTGGTSSQFLMADGSVSTGPSVFITTNVQTGTTYTILNTDNGLQLIFTNSSPITVTIPSGLTSGFNCEVLQQGTGQITFVGSGTTLRVSSFEVLTTTERYALVGIDNMPNLTEEYHLYGSLTSI